MTGRGKAGNREPGAALPIAPDLAVNAQSGQPHPMSDTSKSFAYDVAVLGAGSGGYAAARTAAGLGLKTIVLEGGPEIGGLCILRGCMPTKALLHAAEVRHLAQKASLWGMRIDAVGFDFQKVMGGNGFK